MVIKLFKNIQMKNLYLTACLFMIATMTKGQEFVFLTTGASYNEQVYYQLSDDANVHITNDTWDIAFSFVGDSTGIFVNESVRTSFGTPQNPVVLLDAEDAIWESLINPTDLTNQLYNDEKSWAWGAFNSIRDDSDQNDYGWGQFSEEDNGITGSKIYVVQLRDGSYKKIEIQSFIDHTYTFRYANLDGSDEENVTLSEGFFPNNHLVCFSMASGDFTTEITDQPWDLVFLRYVTPIMDTPFSVSGVLSNYGIQVAEARDINPIDATWEVYQDLLESDIDVIGSDWKEFNNGWIIHDQLSYFVLTEGPRLWKLQFYEFQGSSNGGITFEKTDLTDLVNTQSPSSNLNNFVLSPNPATESIEVVFSLKNKPRDVRVSLLDIQGKELKVYVPNVHLGLNAFRMNDLPREKGVYFVRLESDQNIITQKLVID